MYIVREKSCHFCEVAMEISSSLSHIKSKLKLYNYFVGSNILVIVDFTQINALILCFSP